MYMNYKMTNSELDAKAEKIKSIEKHTYTWILHNFFSVLAKKCTGFCLTSPTFGRLDSNRKWYMDCYPNGRLNNNCVSLTLLPATTCEFPVYFKVYIKNSDDEILSQKTGKVMFIDVVRSYEFPVLALHADLKNIKDDVLKIQVIISIEVISNNKNLLELPQIKLAEDLKAALKENIDTDFVLKVEDFELPVHRFIIASRSPVFSSMVRNNTLEKSKRSMEINDISKETLISLVDFIYAGNAPELSYNEAKNLLDAANKYMLPDLEKICEDELIEKLNFSNVGDVLILADLHNVVNLKNEAINFIVQHHWKFINSTLFQELAEKSTNLLNEVVFKLIKQIPRTTKTS